MKKFFYANGKKMGELVDEFPMEDRENLQTGQTKALERKKQMSIVIDGVFTYGGNNSQNTYEIEICEGEKPSKKVEVQVVNALDGNNSKGKRTTVIVLEAY